MPVVVSAAKCIGCEACIPVCPVQVLEMHDQKSVYKGEGCIECGACVPVCPTEAIDLQVS